MFCSNCGNQLEEGARFCTYCGTKIAPLFDLPTESENTVKEEKTPVIMSKTAFYETALPPSVRTSVETGILFFFISTFIYLFIALFDIVTGLLMAAISLSFGVVIKKTKSTVWAVISCGVSGLALLFGLVSGASFTFWMVFAAIVSVIGCEKFDKAYKEYVITGAVPILSDSDKRAIEARLHKKEKKWVKPLLVTLVSVILIGANVAQAVTIFGYTKEFDEGTAQYMGYTNEFYGLHIKYSGKYDVYTEEELDTANRDVYGKDYVPYNMAYLFFACERELPEEKWKLKYTEKEDCPIVSSIVFSSFFNGTMLQDLNTVADSCLAGIRTQSREKVTLNDVEYVVARFEATDPDTDRIVYNAVFISQKGPYVGVLEITEQSYEALDRLTEKVIGYKYSE